jgi:HEAT repeat protein
MSLRAVCAVLVLFAPTVLYAAAPLRTVEATRLKALLANLDDDDFHIRQRADEELRGRAREVQKQLEAERERTRSPEVRWRLSRILDDLTLDQRIESLVRQLGEPDRDVRQHAEWALRQAGAAAVPLLQQELKPELTASHRKRVERIITELTVRP